MDAINLEVISEEIKTCQRCPLGASRTQAVPGEGNPHPDLVFVGEGPGQTEDETGRPFVGAAGQLLETLLASINLKRADVFITNVVKCRPPQNRDPEPPEIDACAKLYLERQLALLKPKIIVALGRHALAYFLPETFRISEVHGRPFRRHNRIILPLYHPAAALYQASLADVLRQDFGRIPRILTKISQS